MVYISWIVEVHCDHATDDNYGLYTDFYLITTKLTRFPANGLNSILGATRHTRYSSTKIYLTLHTQDSYTFVKYTPSSGALLAATATQWWHGSHRLMHPWHLIFYTWTNDEEIPRVTHVNSSMSRNWHVTKHYMHETTHCSLTRENFINQVNSYLNGNLCQKAIFLNVTE